MPALSPAPTATSRRDFFKRAGFGLGAVAAASTLQACDSDPIDSTVDVTLNFADDVGVLNYAYALEQLEAAFYATVVGDAAFASTFNADERSVLQALAAHEAIHRDFLKAAIAGAVGASAVIPDLTPDFSSVTFSSRSSVLGTAQVFEDLGVSAYNGAGRYLQSPDFLTIAGKIVSVEARHAAVIAGLLSANSIAASGQISASGLDKATDPRDVLDAAGDFIVQRIGTRGLPART